MHGYPRSVRVAVAAFLLLLGVAGIIFPVLPGVPFLVLGLFLLAGAWPAFGRLVRRWLRRHPRLLAAAKKLRRRRSPRREPETGSR
jgi:uncharacterized membrane protein YbaN (DUF454 family)